MSLTYSRLPPEAWRNAGFGAGRLLRAFDVTTGAAADADVLGVTEGPVRVQARPTYTNLAAGVANCPPNAREFLVLNGWDVRLSGTLVTADARAARLLMGHADLDGGRLAPRDRVALDDDFGALWLVFDYGDPPGYYAVHLKNALSTGGFRLQTDRAQRTRWPFEFTAHVDARASDAGFEVVVGQVES